MLLHSYGRDAGDMMRAARKQKKVKPVNVLPAGGICTTHEPDSLPPGKVAVAENVMLMIVEDGRGGYMLQARTRPGTTRLTASPLPDGEQVRASLKMKSTTYLASDVHVFRLDATGAPVLVGEVDRAPRLKAFRGLAVVLDGSYAKSIDPEDGHAYGVLYDIAGYCFDWISGDDDGSWPLYSGGDTMAGFEAQLEDWGPGDLPLRNIKAQLSKTGSPTGDLCAKVYDQAGGLLATSETLDAASLGSAATIQELAFDEPHEAGAADTVRVVIEYDGGDVSNCVNLHSQTVSAGGHGITYDGSWSALDTAKDALIAMGAGLPPKAAWGVVKDSRLYLGGGQWAEAEDTAKLHYCDAMDPYNWGNRTYQGGTAGWIGVERADGAPINGMVKFFDAAIISKCGQDDERSLHLLTGTTPGTDGDLDRETLFNEEGAITGAAMAAAGNNVLYLDEQGLWGVEGVEGFGDARKYPLANDVANLIQAHGNAQALAVFHRTHDQYWLQLDGLDYTLVYHPTVRQWVTYRFTFGAPTCLEHQDAGTYIGAGGHLYELDESVIGADGAYGSSGGEEFKPIMWGPALDMGAQELDKNFKSLSYNISARFGVQGTIMFRLDGSKVHDPALSHVFAVPLDDDVTWRDLAGLEWEDWPYPWSGEGSRLVAHPMNFNAKKIQVGIELDPGGAPAYLGQIKSTYALLGES